MKRKLSRFVASKRTKFQKGVSTKSGQVKTGSKCPHCGKDLFKHGHSGYVCGCRCMICMNGHAEYNRDRRSILSRAKGKKK